MKIISDNELEIPPLKLASIGIPNSQSIISQTQNYMLYSSCELEKYSLYNSDEFFQPQY